MKPNNAGRYMWVQPQTPIQKFKQKVQTLDVDGMEDFSVLYMTQLSAKSQQ